MVAKDVLGAVAVDFSPEAIGKKLFAHRTTQDRYGMEIGFDRGARHAFKRRFGAKHARRPVRFRIAATEQTKQRPTHAMRHGRAQAFFHQVQAVATIAAKGFIATVTRQGNRDVPARQLTDAVGGNRRTVGIGLVVQTGQRVDQIKVVAGDQVTVMAGAVTVGNLLGKLRFVERRIVKGNRAGIHRIVRETGHQRDDRAGIYPSREEGPQRHLGDHAQADRLAQFLVELLTGLVYRTRGIEGKAQVPVFLRRRRRLPTPQGQGMRRGQLARLTKDGSRLGDVTKRKVLLDRQRVDLAREAAMCQQRFEFRAEQEGAIGQQGIVERLDRQPVAREERASRGCGPRAQKRTCRENDGRSPRPRLPRHGR
jgi:hypothetical protein